jgi:hypothetical protein
MAPPLPPTLEAATLTLIICKSLDESGLSITEICNYCRFLQFFCNCRFIADFWEGKRGPAEDGKE